MKDLLSNSGRYVPSFFMMKIDSEHFGNDMTDKELSLFVHEYIHFLQSFTTIKGLEKLTSDYWMLRRMIEYIKEKGKQNVSVPFNKEVLNETTKINEYINRLTWGELDDASYIDDVKLEDVTLDTEGIDVNGDIKIESVYLTLVTADGKENCVSFGARDLFEGMAYLIEQLITKNYEHSPDCPYSTAKMVVDYYYPVLSKDLRNILVLCDVALMFSNPGVEYVEILQYMKKVNFSPQYPEEIYTFIELNWGVVDINKPSNSLSRFIETINEARNILHSCLSYDQYFESYHRWVDIILDYAIRIRLYDPLFWLKIVDNGCVNENQYFKTLLNSIGTPIVEIKKNECFSMNIIDEGVDTYCLSYFRVFYQIYSLLTEGILMCNLLPWCSDIRCNTKPDKCCEYKPWNHCEKKELCPFVAIWNHWGLNGVQIQRK